MSNLHDRILAEGIKANVKTIAPIIEAGDVAVVVFEPDMAVGNLAVYLGWNGRAPAFRLSEQRCEAWAHASEGHGDRVTARWLRAKRFGRILVLAQDGSLLVNLSETLGYSLEPGSSDDERRAVQS